SLYLLDNVRFATNAAALASSFNPLTDALPAEQAGTLQLTAGTIAKSAAVTSDAYVQQGFGSISISANGVIELPASVGLDLAPGASLSLTASQILVGGSISAPGGTVTLKALGTGLAGAGLPTVAVGSGAQITTA